MEALLDRLKLDDPSSIASERILLNAAGTAAQPGHRGTGTAITFRGDDSIIPRVLVPHRLFTHTLGVRLDVPAEKQATLFKQIRDHLRDAVPHETLDEQARHTSLQQLVDDFGEEAGNDSHYQQYLPYEAWASLMRANETAEDEEHYYFVIKTHSGLAGRQLISKLWPRLDSRISVDTMRSSKEYRAVEAYAEFMARGLLMTYLTALGLNEYVADLPCVAKQSKRETNIVTRDPHFDMVTNCFDGLTLLNECYDVKSCLGDELFFLADTLHNGILLQRPKADKRQELFMPAHGNFFDDSAKMAMTDKHHRRNERGEWCFTKDYIFATPACHVEHYRTTAKAMAQLRHTINDDVVFDTRRGIAPIYQVCH